jgi:hypothetical protein
MADLHRDGGLGRRRRRLLGLGRRRRRLFLAATKQGKTSSQSEGEAFQVVSHGQSPERRDFLCFYAFGVSEG